MRPDLHSGVPCTLSSGRQFPLRSRPCTNAPRVESRRPNLNGSRTTLSGVTFERVVPESHSAQRSAGSR